LTSKDEQEAKKQKLSKEKDQLAGQCGDDAKALGTKELELPGIRVGPTKVCRIGQDGIIYLTSATQGVLPKLLSQGLMIQVFDRKKSTKKAS